MDLKELIQEINLKAIRSSGSGGQHINKVATKIELQFKIKESRKLSQIQKDLISVKLKNRLTKEGVLILQCGTTRSQLKNKQLVINRFLAIIAQALSVQKPRVPSKVPRAAIKRRLDNKRKTAQKKANRKKPDIE
ncbi:alternative ribosome rescue aminoacyl-tRNA hydrolase ArfB [Pontimicrobium sp. IMCC45349]|uniref:alternative ribosome rescue aminoacyl-tRNA hydrolase ArfB n=1 Tax=Pontimicrobium sp. IMCC45349 TaxID=3391574 RepID=UPI0039A325B8